MSNVKSELLKLMGKKSRTDFLNEETLDEGLTLFKDSSKLERLAFKLEKSIMPQKDKLNPKQYESVISLVNKIKYVAKLFRELEIRRKKASSKEEKAELQNEYKNLKLKYYEILKIIKSNKIANVLKATIIPAIIVGSLVLILKGLYDYQTDVETNTFKFPYATNTREGNSVVRKIHTFSFTNTKEIESLSSRLFAPTVVLGGASLVGIFSKIFKNKSDELYLKTLNAVKNLAASEKAELKRSEGDEE